MNVLLKNLQSLPHYPHAVQGQSGITYGHAMFDPERNAHVFRMPYEDWIGPKGTDIASRETGPMNRYHVLFEQGEGEPTTLEKELAETLANVRAELATAQREIDRLQRAGLVDQTEPADRRIVGNSATLESAAQDSQLARHLADTERGVNIQGPAEGLPAAPTSLDEAEAGFLIAAKKGLPLEETRVETNEDTGAAELVKREATPAASGVPNQPVGDTSVTPFVNVKETRTPLEPAEGESNLVASAKKADTTKPVNDPENANSSVPTLKDEPVNSPAQGSDIAAPAPVAADNAATNAKPNEKSNESDLTQYKGNFRKLRSIAQSEGVADFEKITKSEDMIAAIQLHRESKVTGN